ncbi:hypothetical protein Dimus_013692 [Dionaea muscipula]
MSTLSCWGKWVGGVGWDEGLLCWVSSDDEGFLLIPLNLVHRGCYEARVCVGMMDFDYADLVLDWWRLICGAFDGVLLLLSFVATVMLLRDFDCVGVFWGGLVARGESLVGFDCGV